MTTASSPPARFSSIQARMFAAAEPDFELEFFRFERKQRREIARAGLREIERECREEFFVALGLLLAQLVPFAAAEKSAALVRGAFLFVDQNALRSLSARSVFSHEKPPSLSALRPK